MFWVNFQTTNHTFDLVPSLFFIVDQEQIFTLNSSTMAVCAYVNISSVVEFQRWWVLKSKIFAMW